MPTYAVTGATGKFGRLAIHALLHRGVVAASIVAVARSPKDVEDLAALGVVVRWGDYDLPESLRTALAGVNRLLLVSGDAQGKRATQHANVIEAAQACGVERIVYTSILHANTSGLPLAPDHRATEATLSQSGVHHTILRNGWYLENYTDQAARFVAEGKIVGAAGDARVAAAPRGDYAEAAAAALLDDRKGNLLYELGGPEFSFPELADAISQATGSEVRYHDVSPEDFRAELTSANLPDGLAEFLEALEEGTRRGELSTSSPDLQQLLGRPARHVVAATDMLLA